MQKIERVVFSCDFSPLKKVEEYARLWRKAEALNTFREVADFIFPTDARRIKRFTFDVEPQYDDEGGYEFVVSNFEGWDKKGNSVRFISRNAIRCYTSSLRKYNPFNKRFEIFERLLKEQKDTDNEFLDVSSVWEVNDAAGIHESLLDELFYMFFPEAYSNDSAVGNALGRDLCGHDTELILRDEILPHPNFSDFSNFSEFCDGS